MMLSMTEDNEDPTTLLAEELEKSLDETDTVKAHQTILRALPIHWHVVFAHRVARHHRTG